MKVLFIMLFLCSGLTYASLDMEFLQKGCTYTAGPSSPTIITKINGNTYETSSSHSKPADTILTLKSVSYTSKGLIKDKIFIEGGLKMINGSYVQVFEESKDCKILWTKISGDPNDSSYPRLSENEYNVAISAHKNNLQSNKKKEEIALSKEKEKLISNNQKEMLKKVSNKGLQLFIDKGCIDPNHWQLADSEDNKHFGIFLVSRNVKGGLGWTEVPLLEGFIYQPNSEKYEVKGYFIKTEKLHNNLTIYKKSPLCKSILEKNPSSALKRKSTKKRKAKSLYE